MLRLALIALIASLPAATASAQATFDSATETTGAQTPSSPTADQPIQAAPFLDLNAPEISTSNADDTGIDSDLLINFGLWMVVILCLCGLTAIGLRLLNQKGVVSTGAPSGARVIESLNLGRHRSVQLVEIGGRSVIVASDSSGIRSVVPLVDDFTQSLQDATDLLEESDS